MQMCIEASMQMLNILDALRSEGLIGMYAFVVGHDANN